MSLPREVIAAPLPGIGATRAFDKLASVAVRGGAFVFVSGLTAFDPATGAAIRGTTSSETRQILENLERILEASGSSLDRVVKVNVLLHSMLEAPNMNEIYARFFPEPPPARTVCGARLPEGVKVMIECTALASDDGRQQRVGLPGSDAHEGKEVTEGNHGFPSVRGTARPEPSGERRPPRLPRSPIEPVNPVLNVSRSANLPHVPGIRVGEYIFLSGMGPIDPLTGERRHGPIADQVRTTLNNMKHMLESAGSSLERVVRVHVVLADIGDIAETDRVYREFFPVDPPARTAWSMQLRFGNGCEIECVALAAARKPTVVVIGASGYIGTNLVPALAARGYRVRAVARSREVLAARAWPGVELAQADVLHAQSLAAALAGQDIAYYLVHCMRAGDAFDDIERQGAQNFAEAAAHAGVKRIVYLGGLIPRGVDSKHLVSRRLTGEILRAGRVPVTELRAGIIVGPGCASFEIIRDLVNHLPVMVTPRWVRSKSPPIALSNVLTYLIEVADRDEAAGQIYDLAGPEELSYEDLMRQYGRAVGKRPVIFPVPVLSPRLSSYWLRLVTAVPTSTARALIDGLKLHIKADDSEIRRLVPQHLLTYDEAVGEVFEAEQRNAVAARWTEGALMYRDYNPNYAFYAMRDSGSFVARASPEEVWAQVAAIGGANRYYAVNWLWSIRETMDWALGGPGRHRGRRHPTQVRVGDAIDSWRVIACEPPRRLTLAFGMRAPGAGVLEFDVAPTGPEHTRITVTAYWHPAGVWGLLYWYAFAPSHFLVFRGMARAIARRAERPGAPN